MILAPVLCKRGFGITFSERSNSNRHADGRCPIGHGHNGGYGRTPNAWMIDRAPEYYHNYFVGYSVDTLADKNLKSLEVEK